MSPCCIWCKQEGIPSSVEHIIPEALGCPPSFVLSGGEVCRQCNNELAYLDRAVVDEFDIVAFQSGVPRKFGRPPRIDSRGNVVGYHTDSGPAFAINMERHPVTTPDGVRVAALGKSSRNVRAKFKRTGDEAQMSFEVSIGSSPLFGRGIHKIALSSVAHFLGAETALRADLDPVRGHVRDNSGQRRIVAMTTDDPDYRNVVWAPYKNSEGDLSVALRLTMIEFLVDLSPHQNVLPSVIDHLSQVRGNKGWTLLPITSSSTSNGTRSSS